MFNLTFTEHLQLIFGHIVESQQRHTQLAWSRGRWSRGLRGAEALLMTSTAGTALAAALGKGTPFAIAAAVLSGLALVTLMARLTFDFDATAEAHRACAARLWRIREHYRVLLSDLSDGTITLDAARQRRDLLIDELHSVYEQAPLASPVAFAAAGNTPVPQPGAPSTGKEVERFMAAPLQKSGASPAA